MKITVERKTLESRMTVFVDDGARDPEGKKKLSTPLSFFNHMLEQLVWRSELNIGVEVELDHFFLNHVVCEDTGIALGKAFRELMLKKQDAGAPGYGFALSTIDEALARAVVSFESRAYLDLNFNGIQVPENTEGIQCEDLVSFWEGFVQGAMCTLHLDLLKARANHGHHQWESMFRAVGQAMCQAFGIREWRQNMAAGVAGKIDYRIMMED